MVFLRKYSYIFFLNFSYKGSVYHWLSLMLYVSVTEREGNLSGFNKNGMVESGEYIKHTRWGPVYWSPQNVIILIQQCDIHIQQCGFTMEWQTVWSRSTLDHFRNEFHFSEVHWSMNAMGHVQSKWRPLGVTLTLHGTRCVHTSMNLRQMKFISYIYTLFLHHFCSLFVKKKKI